MAAIGPAPPGLRRPLAAKVRTYWLGFVVCMAAFLFGYDSGVVGGVITLPSFVRDFHFGGPGETSTSRAQSLAVSLQNLGCFVGCFLVWPLAKRFGRKYTLIASASLFCVGVAIETSPTRHLSAFYIARVIAGLGLGAATVIVPMYSSEMTPRELRGQVGCFFQWFYTIGIFVSYWIAYAVDDHMKSTTKQWQIPIGLQLVPAALLGLGMLSLPESLRWYITQDRYDDAWRALTWIRASDGPEVQEEFEEIKAGVDIEEREIAAFTFNELLSGKPLALFATAFVVFMAQQSTGATAFAYYSAVYFKAMVGGTGTQALLLSGIFGAVKVLACGFFVWFLANRVGRRRPMIYGALAMSMFMVIAAAVVATHSKSPKGVTSEGIAVVAMIYLFVMAYNMSWGALPWPYVSEIFPTRLREIGIAVGVASQWLWAFVYTFSNPYMIASLGWGTLLFWGITNLLIAGGSWLFIKETNGLTLEQINADFFDHRKELDAQVEHVERRSVEEVGSGGSGSARDAGSTRKSPI